MDGLFTMYVILKVDVRQNFYSFSSMGHSISWFSGRFRGLYCHFSDWLDEEWWVSEFDVI